MIRLFTMEDYEETYQLWKETPGVGLRQLDDSKEGIDRFIRRNPTTSFTACEDGRIVGVALSGHDGRRGYLYHICVNEAYRNRTIGRQLIEQVMKAMRAEKINKLALVCFADNNSGNRFWNLLGWKKRMELNYYTFDLTNNE